MSTEPVVAPKPLRVLVIEDSEPDALLLLEELRASGYAPEARRVDNAEDLVDALDKQKWDIVFSDHHMPRFSSTEALEIVRSSALDVPFIIVSGVIGEDAAVAAMRAGAQDYLMKGNLTRLGVAVARELAEAEERRAHRKAERALLAQEEELRIAREVQRQLFPAGSPDLPGYDLAGASRPATVPGGDYFDFIPTPQGRWLVVVGDVTGHGLGSAMLMAAARAYLRALALAGQAFEAILAQARHLLIEDLGEDHFITLLIAELDPATGVWRYVNAGHPTGYVLGAAGAIKARLEAHAAAVGIDRGEERLEPRQIALEKGDAVLLLTDGILAVHSKAGSEFGEARALEYVWDARAKPAAQIISGLLDAAARFGDGPGPREDDMTAVLVKRLAEAARD
jgi:serine phosphatase RsbU (regulator of sigma subunit)